MTVDSFYFPQTFVPNKNNIYIVDIESLSSIEVYIILPGQVRVKLPSALPELEATYTIEYESYLAPTQTRARVELLLSTELPEGSLVQFLRKTTIERDVVFGTLQPFPTKGYEYDFDKITYIQQEIEGHACACPPYPAFPGIPAEQPVNPFEPPEADDPGIISITCEDYSCVAFDTGLKKLVDDYPDVGYIWPMQESAVANINLPGIGMPGYGNAPNIVSNVTIVNDSLFPDACEGDDVAVGYAEGEFTDHFGAWDGAYDTPNQPPFNMGQGLLDYPILEFLSDEPADYRRLAGCVLDVRNTTSGNKTDWYVHVGSVQYFWLDNPEGLVFGQPGSDKYIIVVPRQTIFFGWQNAPGRVFLSTTFKNFEPNYPSDSTDVYSGTNSGRRADMLYADITIPASVTVEAASGFGTAGNIIRWPLKIYRNGLTTMETFWGYGYEQSTHPDIPPGAELVALPFVIGGDPSTDLAGINMHTVRGFTAQGETTKTGVSHFFLLNPTEEIGEYSVKDYLRAIWLQNHNDFTLVPNVCDYTIGDPNSLDCGAVTEYAQDVIGGSLAYSWGFQELLNFIPPGANEVRLDTADNVVLGIGGREMALVTQLNDAIVINRNGRTNECSLVSGMTNVSGEPAWFEYTDMPVLEGHMMFTLDVFNSVGINAANVFHVRLYSDAAINNANDLQVDIAAEAGGPEIAEMRIRQGVSFSSPTVQVPVPEYDWRPGVNKPQLLIVDWQTGGGAGNEFTMTATYNGVSTSLTVQLDGNIINDPRQFIHVNIPGSPGRVSLLQAYEFDRELTASERGIMEAITKFRYAGGGE